MTNLKFHISLIIVILLCLLGNIAISQNCLPGGIIFSSQNQVDDFPVNYPGCTTIEGNVTIGSNVLNFDSLAQVTEIGGYFQFGTGTQFTNFSGLHNLTEIGGFFYANNTKITSMNGLQSLEKIGGYLFWGTNLHLINIDSLISLDTIMGYVQISSNSKISELSGLDSLKYIGGELNINSNASLKSLNGLQSLNYLGSDFHVIGNDSLLNLNGIESLTEINGEFEIYGNEQLNDISNLTMITSIAGNLSVSWNDSLTTLCGLENIDYTSINTLALTNNQKLATCELDNICDFIDSAGPGHLYISGNATGCKFPFEVMDKCTLGINPCCDIAIASITTQASDCVIADGSIDISATCGTCGALEYSIDNVIWQPSSLFTALAAGNYNVYVRDSGNITCSITQVGVIVPVDDDLNYPTASCTDTMVYLNINGIATLNPSLIDNNSTDNCGIDSLWVSQDSFYCIDLGIQMATLFVVDESGNQSSCTSQIMVMDTLVPTAICYDTVVLYLDAVGNIDLDWTMVDNNSFDNCGGMVISLSQTQYDCTEIGFQMVDLVALDTSGNMSSCSSVVSILDTIAPSVICMDLSIDLDDNGMTIIDTSTGGGSGLFTLNQDITSINSSATDVALGDLDSDGDLDLFISSYGPNLVFINNGNGTFTDSGQTIGNSSSISLSLGDLDGDGDLDAFVVNYSQGNRIWINNGNGVFTDLGIALGHYRSNAVSLGDLDGDGDLDAFVTNYQQQNKIWLNDGDGAFTDSGQIFNIDYNYNNALGDLDGDGDLDALIVSYLNVSIWFNDGTGTLSDSGQTIGNLNNRDISLSDLDGDGDWDAFIVGSYESSVWLNDSHGIFIGSGQYLGFADGYSVSSGDLDGDGDWDVYISGISNSSWLLYNEGYGLFDLQNVNSGISASRTTAIGDLNGNNALDIFALNMEGTFCHSSRWFRYHCHSGYLGEAEVWLNNPSTSVIEDYSDNCSDYDVTIQLSQDTFTISDIGPNLIDVLVTDSSGNSNDCVSIVTITDCGCNPDFSPLIPNTASGIHYADCKGIDGAFTHFCDNQGRLLLSIDTPTANGIEPTEVSINIQAGGYYYDQYCGNTPGDHSGNCFINNEDGAVILCRTWDVDSDSMNATIRYYFDQGDIDIVNQVNYNQGLDPITDPSQFWFYKVLNAMGHSKPEDLQSSDVIIIDNDGSNESSLDNWSLGNIPNAYYAEYKVSSFSGGGGGIADKGSSAVCPYIVAGITGDQFPDSLGVLNVFVNIEGGTSPYDILLSNGQSIENYNSGDNIEVIVDFFQDELALVTVKDSNGCPQSEFDSFLTIFNSFGDTIPPIAICKDTSLTLELFATSFLDPSSLDGESTDNDFIGRYSANKIIFTCNDIGSTAVELTVYDLSGNSSVCTSTVTLTDPLLACCIIDRHINQIPIGFKEYFAKNILSDGEVKYGNGNTDVLFDAENGVELLQGFQVEEGAIFTINIDPCGN